MKVKGYKCFNKDLTNRYGTKFCVGQIYIASGIVKFGNNGFHMCKNIEDTFRYFDTTNKDIRICEVIGSGNYTEHSDEYYGYYDMYSVEKLEIIKELSREEIIEKGLHLKEQRAERFVSTLTLTKEEISLFKEVFKNNQRILKAIAYYQENDKQAYTKQKLLIKEPQKNNLN